MQDHDYHFLTQRVQGNILHDSPDTGRPVKIGGKASTSEPTAVGNGDRVNAYFDANGYLMVKVASVSGNVTVVQPTHDNLNANANMQVGNTDVANGNPVPVSDAGGSLTVDGTVNATAAGDVAHDAADSGNPVKMGGVAKALGSNPTEVADGDRTDLYATLAGVPYMIAGHPNVLRETANYTAAQTDTAIHTTTASHRFVITGIDVFVDNACSVDVGVTIEFDDTVDVKVVQHPGIAPGSGFVVGHAGGILAVGGSGQNVIVTAEVPTGGSVSVHVTGYEEPA